jgi:hypothetical protein
MTMTINGTSGLVFNDASTQNTAATGFGFKNRIINGAMVIDQRNAGASVTPTTDITYTLDRFKVRLNQASKFSVQQNAGAVTPPVGFRNYLGITSLSSYSSLSGDYFGLMQSIEGFNTADWGFGTASATPITMSFWVRSSLTGQFSGLLFNNGDTRNYTFVYTINSANTWEYKTITIAGDTGGTWLTNNGNGLQIWWDLGSGSSFTGSAQSWTSSFIPRVSGSPSVVGTNGATFYITGVQLEKGSTATSFDYRPYGTELALCQRYYEKSYDIGTVPNASVTLGQFNSGGVQGATTTSEVNGGSPVFAVQKRATPTVTVFDTNGNSGKVNRVQYGVTNNFNSTGSPSDIGQTTFTVISGSGATASGLIYQWTASAEL